MNRPQYLEVGAEIIFQAEGGILVEAKNQESITHNMGVNLPSKIDPDLTQMLELADKDIKIVILSAFYVFR